MSSKNKAIGLIALSFVAITPLLGGYYQDTLFPIGLTGLNFTGRDPYEPIHNCPFSNLGPEGNPYWTWDKERELINGLGINCIGCSDSYHSYLLDFDPNSTYIYNYLHQICMTSYNPGKPNPIYILPNSYYAPIRYYDYRIGSLRDDPDAHFRANTLFRSPYRGGCSDPNKTHQAGYGASVFSPDCSVEGWQPWGTTSDANWSTCDGDIFGHWQWMVDSAIANFEAYFTNHSDHAAYIWGFNLITEDPAIYRGDKFTPPWHGAWAAVDRVFTGHHNGKFSITPASHYGFRGEIDGVYYSNNRMIIAKGGTSPMHRGGYNIFGSLPDIDAFVIYSHGWCHADWNYGSQAIFDWWLYGDPAHPNAKGGLHNTALYFKQYGGTTGGPSGQMRRWIPAICLEWQIDMLDLSKALARRPCPPEIRCATYLVLSRGAKGILFHPWTYNYPDPVEVSLDPSLIRIPCYNTSEEYYNLGLRDQAGYPFGKASPRDHTHKLNNGVGSTHWHDHNADYTYYYLANTLIPEIKRLAPWLVTMTWDTAFSRDCSLIFWNPIRYVMACRTRNIFVGDHVDVGFFKDPAQVDYFMVVNRSRIAPYKLAKIRIEIDKNKGQNGHLWITDLYDTTVYDLPHVNGNPNNNYLLDMNFQPGQGRLFALASDVALAPKPPKLWVYWIPYKTTYDALGRINFGGPANGLWWARLDWTFDRQDWDFQSYKANRFGLHYLPPAGCTPFLGNFLTLTSYDKRWCVDDHSNPMCGTLPFYLSGECGQWRVDAVISKGGNTTTLQSNVVSKCAPDVPPGGGCPTVYALTEDSLILYAQCNSILPHSEFSDTAGTDMLVLDALPKTSNGHYYLNISEDTSNLSHIDQLKLWVVDHPGGTKVATTANGQILVYSDVVLPYTCDDQNLANRLDEMREPSEAFTGSTGGWLELSFPDYGWEKKALLVSTGLPSEEWARQKNNEALVSVQDTSGNWIPKGYAYTRHTPCTYLVDVSDDTMGCFRLDCFGDSMNINYVSLVKLDSTDVTIIEAPLDSALRWHQVGENWITEGVTGVVRILDQQVASIEYGEQLSLRFDSVRTVPSGFVRDFVLESHGVYTIGTVGGGPQSDTVNLIPFSLEVMQNEPLSKVAAIRYSLPYAAKVRIAMYDIQGRLVTELIDKEVKAGYYSLEWQGKDDAGRKVSAGIYFVKMTTSAYNATRKLVVLR